MRAKNTFKHLIVFFLLLILSLGLSFAQRTGYTKDEFMRRRKALADRAKEGMIILFGETLPQPGAHFRQDNDFFYFTGIEDLGAIFVMNAKTSETHLFLPRQAPREAMVSGPNLLSDEKAKEKTGLANLYDVTYFDEFISRNMRNFSPAYLRLQPGDTVDNSRSEVALFLGRKNRIHYNDQISPDNDRIQKLKERYPSFEFKDITPHIDALRMIKSAEEISVMRRNGKISAEAVKQAMLASRPGVFEYEIEAAAMQVVLRGGAKGAAYAPIVGSGPNSCIWHYEKNARKTKPGDLVLMDFGADLDQLCMDITRTWPASGKFTQEQREVYQVVLEVEKACIEAYKPGAGAADVQKHVEEVLKKKGLDSRGLRGGFGHFVGMCVHDVGPRLQTLQEGMVFAIEPALYYPEKNIGIRIEDTVLITKDGCEVLTKNVPKELDEIENLITAVKPRKLAGEPDRIAVQHILIAFKGSIPEEKVTRTPDEAQALAEQILERVKRGENFDTLVKQYTDDEYPGIYKMTNFGIEPDKAKKEYSRSGMVKSFGDVSFGLSVNGIGLAVYDQRTSKYGWHIIKRLE
jgi:Xaa-Pro aminopeptidase